MNDRVPFGTCRDIIKRILDANLISIPNGGHLNGSAGGHEFPKCLEVLNKMMK